MWGTILLPLTWSWILIQWNSEAAQPLLLWQNVAPHKPGMICQLHSAWNSLTVFSLRVPGVYIFHRMVVVLMESTLMPWSSKKSWQCLNRDGEQPWWAKTQVCCCLIASELIGVWGVLGIFPINKHLWIFVVVFLYNKTDYREWFISGLYWELCM